MYNPLDYKLAHENPHLYDLIKKDIPGFYIEAGAYDGKTQSTTLALDKWKGLLIEPSPLFFSACLYNRPNVPCINCALVSSAYKEEYIWGNFLESSPMSVVGSIPDYFESSLKREYEEKGQRNQIKVRARTLQSILDEHDVRQVDFLSLDVEGFELEVLNGTDLDKVYIDWILIETANRTWYQDLIRSYMYANGYEFVMQASGNDDLFRKRKNNYGRY